MLGLRTKSGLRPCSRYKLSLYTTEAATYKAINRTVQTCVQPRIQATGSRGSSHNEEKDKCNGNQGFKGGCKGKGRVRGSVKVEVKHGGEIRGETRDIVRKNKREEIVT